MKRIYTFGYANAELADLVTLAREGAVVVDIRFNPTSRLSEWRQPALKRALGAAYRHEPRLGNADYRGGGVQIVDLAGGATAVAALAVIQPVVLLCACADVGRCHRKVIVDYLTERHPGLEVVHLGRKVERRCRCGRFLDPGESACPFCAPPPRQTTFQEWCDSYSIIVAPPQPMEDAPQEQTDRAALGSTVPADIDAAVARYCRGLEEIEQELGAPVPWKWRQINPLSVAEAEAVLQEAAVDLGLALHGRSALAREPEPAEPEEWPVDEPFAEDVSEEWWAE